MLRFEFLERLGVAVAAMSDLSDGDCSQPATRDAFCVKCGIRVEDLVRTRQVHGAEVVVVTAQDQGRGVRPGLSALESCDGMVTQSANTAMAVSVADCVPVFLYDPVRKAGGIVHAGREGTRLGISAEAVRRLSEAYGCIAKDLYAVIGPSAGPCCYEVSEDMAEDWVSQGLPANGRRLDLWRTNWGQLREAGVPESHIEVAGACTVCGGRFFSYRRGNGSARNLAILCL